MSEQEAAAAVLDVLALAALAPAKDASSGIVEQRRIFARAHPARR